MYDFLYSSVLWILESKVFFDFLWKSTKLNREFTKVNIILNIIIKDLKPQELVRVISQGKAEASELNPGEILICADTVVAFEGEIFGKPPNQEIQLGPGFKETNHLLHFLIFSYL